jgi:hypothetical protein
MAKRTMTALQRSYFAPRAPAAIVVSAPRRRARAAPRRRARRRRSSGGVGGGIVGGNLIPMALGGALYGFAVKSGYVDKLPAVPMLGRTGTAALLLNYWGRHGGGQLVKSAGVAAAVLAGYQLGHEGKITGDDMSGLTTTGFDTSGDDMSGDD